MEPRLNTERRVLCVR